MVLVILLYHSNYGRVLKYIVKFAKYSSIFADVTDSFRRDRFTLPQQINSAASSSFGDLEWLERGNTEQSRGQIHRKTLQPLVELGDRVIIAARRYAAERRLYVASDSRVIIAVDRLHVSRIEAREQDLGS